MTTDLNTNRRRHAVSHDSTADDLLATVGAPPSFVDDRVAGSPSVPPVAVLQTATTKTRWREPNVSQTFYARTGKTIMDRSLACVGLVVLSPLIAAVALAVRVSMGRGVLFRQQRIGRHGEPFVVLKFRTMCHDRRRLTSAPYGGQDRRVTHKTAVDPRHTQVGRFLRASSLDELPQLVNVVRGEMSLVGPRPELVTVAERHGLVAHPRHAVRPGITGLWQISEFRDELLHHNMHIDIDYVERITLAEDLRILRSTLFALSRGR